MIACIRRDSMTTCCGRILMHAEQNYVFDDPGHAVAHYSPSVVKSAQSLRACAECVKAAQSLKEPKP